MANFGELLAELRLDRKMTQRDLANILHVSIGTISNYEKGVHYPDIEKLVDLANFFDISTDYLLGRSEYTFSPDVLSEHITSEKSAGDIIKVLRQLPQDRKEAILLILSDMELHVAISQYGRGTTP